LVGTRLWTSRFLSHEERDALGNVVVSTRSVSANTDLVRQGERADSLLSSLMVGHAGIRRQGKAVASFRR